MKENRNEVVLEEKDKYYDKFESYHLDIAEKSEKKYQNGEIKGMSLEELFERLANE